MKNYTKGVIAINLSAFCFALLYTLGVLLFKGGATPITILVGRFSIASLLFFFTILLYKKKLFRVARRDIKWFVLVGLILFGQIMTFWYALQNIKTVSILIGMFFTYPIWTAILTSLILRERIKKIIPACIAIGLLGVLFVLGIIPSGASIVSIVGILLALSTALLWAMYYVGSQFLQSKEYSFLTIAFYNFLFVLLACLVLQPISVTISEITLSVFWYLLALAFVASYCAYGFLQYAIKKNGVVMIGIQNMIQPAFAVIIALVVLHQQMTLFQTAGIGIILFNIYLLNKSK